MKTINITLIFLFFTKITTQAQVDSTIVKSVEAIKVEEPAVEKIPNWEKSIGLGLSVSHSLSINPPSANTPRQGFSSANSLDGTLNYIKETSRFKIQNDFNWVFNFIRASGKEPTINNTDVFNLNHDISYTFKKGGDWNVNIILNETSPILTLYDNNYLKDYNQLGPIQRFLNPYTYTISPGIKYQPNKYLGISLSPYSMQFTGLSDQTIADKDLHFQDQDDRILPDGHYKTQFSKTLGAATNIWYNRNIKKKIDIRYKLAVTTNYFENILKNGTIDGQFSTSFNIFKGFSISHKAFLKGNLATKPLKLNYTQVILFGYKLSF